MSAPGNNAEGVVELLPCPFCRMSKAEISLGSAGLWTVFCHACEAEGPHNPTDGALAASAWNDRPSPEAVMPIEASIVPDAKLPFDLRILAHGRCIAKVYGVHALPDWRTANRLAAALKSAPSAGVMPIEAVTEEMIAQGRVQLPPDDAPAAPDYERDLVKRIYTAMRAAAPPAPVQLDHQKPPKGRCDKCGERLRNCSCPPFLHEGKLVGDALETARQRAIVLFQAYALGVGLEHHRSEDQFVHDVKAFSEELSVALRRPISARAGQ